MYLSVQVLPGRDLYNNGKGTNAKRSQEGDGRCDAQNEWRVEETGETETSERGCVALCCEGSVRGT